LPKYFEDPLLEKAKIICLEQMPIQGEAFEDIKKYFNLYTQNYTDTLFINNYESKYLLNIKKLIGISINVDLIDLNNRKVTLKSIISNLKGKLIYVDFWASWCAPCRAAMPASRKLQDDFDDKDIAFIYISIDTDFDKWRNASIEDNLSLNKNNLLALNYPAADFYQNLKLNTIPRYILFDKNGELVHQNAQGPKGEDIRILLDEYLKK